MSLKIWYRTGATAVLSLALSTTIAVAQDHGHAADNDNDKHDREDDDHGSRHVCYKDDESCGNQLVVLDPEVPKNKGGRIVVSDRRIIQHDSSYNSTPGVIETSTGDYLLTYRKGPGHSNSPTVILRRSLDKGVTWTSEVAQWNTANPDPSMARMPVSGDIVVAFGKLNPQSVAGQAYTRSSDNGNTWNALTFFANPVSDAQATPSPYINDGTTVYAASYQPHGDGTYDSTLWWSLDDGFTWSLKSIIRQAGDAGINETTILKTGPTTLLSINRSDSNTETWAHISNDLGVTWGTQIDYTSQVGILQQPILIQIAPNTILLFGRNYPQNQLKVLASYDNGTTFTGTVILDTYTGSVVDGGYCWPLLREDGKVFLVYYGSTINQLPDIKSLVLKWKN